MAEVLLFHHAQGLTTGVRSFAEDLRAAGHVVHAPDLYDGRTFTDLVDGVRYAKQVGFDTIVERGRRAADGLPNALICAGFSLEVLPAQLLAQTRRAPKGTVLLRGCFPSCEFGGPWRPGVPHRIHVMDADEWGLGSDPGAARQLAATV